MLCPKVRVLGPVMGAVSVGFLSKLGDLGMIGNLRAQRVEVGYRITLFVMFLT